MRRLAASLVLVLSASIETRAQIGADHLGCFKIKDALARTKYTADLDGLAVQPGCTIKVPATMACVPTAKSNVQPTPPGGGGTGMPNSFFCYKVKCPKVVLPTFTGADQFASRNVVPTVARLLCAPLAGSSTTTTTATTTTTSSTMTVPCPTAELLATGQTTCYAVPGVGGYAIPCDGTGQDGETQAGRPLSYADNGDGTITDNNTGLMWEKLSDDGSVHDKDATYDWGTVFTQHIDVLNSGSGFAEHTDWRLPNVRELQSIVNYARVNPPVSDVFNNGACVGQAIPSATGCTVLTCSCTAISPYWSSTRRATPPDPGAWHVYFGEGGVYPEQWATGAKARAVRGGS